MMRTNGSGGLNEREKKAEALDSAVKTELSKKRAADAAKIAKLKALRLARDAAETKAETPAEEPVKAKPQNRKAPRQRFMP
jgi:hypothetical protein